MGYEGVAGDMIVIADAGPILHLYWVDAISWALPPQTIEVVQEVWQEVDKYEPRALTDSRLRRRVATLPYPSELSAWGLDSGELAALSYAVRHRNTDSILVLCDEHEARKACTQLAIPVVGSVGLIVRAFHAGRIVGDVAQRALRDLPHRGRLHVTESLIELAVEMLSQP
jgi:predicted nucleic acid-binding protein